jgi:hypothetical protein
MTRMLSVGRLAHFRDDGLGCLGSYRTMRVALGPVYFSIGWRISR